MLDTSGIYESLRLAADAVEVDVPPTRAEMGLALMKAFLAVECPRMRMALIALTESAAERDLELRVKGKIVQG